MNAKQSALRELARREAAKRSLLHFCQRMYPNFQVAPHLEYIAGLLEQVEAGELPRLIISVHPGSGKSTLLQLFAGWYLGRNPSHKIIATSAAERLVVRNSRATRDLFGETEWPFDARLAADATAAGMWETQDGGGLFGVGVEGTLTGFRGKLLVSDDIQDGPGSKLERDAVEEWFRGKLTTRLEPGGAIIIIQTRYTRDDLPGRLMAGRRGKAWTYVRLPALSEGEGDPLERPEGVALWPARFDVKALEDLREDIGPKHFASQYQGNPVQDGGEIIRAEWLQYYDRPPENVSKIVAALDAASKTGVRNDYSAIVVLGIAPNGYYVLDVIRERVEYPRLKRMVEAVSEKYRPSKFYVEDTSNATALIQQLKHDSHLPIIPVKPKGSKESRVEGISGIVEAGKLFLPRLASWLGDFEAELTDFPSGDHDDMVDALTIALSQVSLRKFYGSVAIGDDGITRVDGNGIVTHEPYDNYTGMSGITQNMRSLTGGW